MRKTIPEIGNEVKLKHLQICHLLEASNSSWILLTQLRDKKAQVQRG